MVLVLSRKRNETIVTGERIYIHTDTRGDKVPLGVEVQQKTEVAQSDTDSRIIVPFQRDSHHSCFLSYSRKDKEFALSLHKRLEEAGIDVWIDQADMKGGQKSHEQISGAIRVSDKLLLVLSEASMCSQWAHTEIRWALRAERESGERKLFPIGLVDYERLKAWECFDADSGRDLAVEIREYHIPDFSNWTTPTSFDADCRTLVRDLSK